MKNIKDFKISKDAYRRLYAGTSKSTLSISKTVYPKLSEIVKRRIDFLTIAALNRATNRNQKTIQSSHLM